MTRTLKGVTDMKCCECGKDFRGRNVNSRFCSTSCRQSFNNRRMQRGAILLDLAMIEIFDKAAFDKYELAKRREELFVAWRQEDKERRTWKPALEVHFDLSELNRS